MRFLHVQSGGSINEMLVDTFIEIEHRISVPSESLVRRSCSFTSRRSLETRVFRVAEALRFRIGSCHRKLSLKREVLCKIDIDTEIVSQVVQS